MDFMDFMDAMDSMDGMDGGDDALGPCAGARVAVLRRSGVGSW
jgi:hypothetical protein